MKHVWPSDAKVLASIQGFNVNTSNGYPNVNGYLVLGGLLVRIEPVERAWSTRTGDIEVSILDELEHKETLKIRYDIDYVDSNALRRPQVYGLRMTCRIGLLLRNRSWGNGIVERVGLFVVAKSDTIKWTAITGERDVTVISVRIV